MIRNGYYQISHPAAYVIFLHYTCYSQRATNRNMKLMQSKHELEHNARVVVQASRMMTCIRAMNGLIPPSQHSTSKKFLTCKYEFTMLA